MPSPRALECLVTIVDQGSLTKADQHWQRHFGRDDFSYGQFGEFPSISEVWLRLLEAYRG